MQAFQHLVAPFAPFLADPETTEVVVNKVGEFGVERSGQWSFHASAALSFDKLDAIGVLAAFATAQELSPDAPLCATTLPGGERLQVCRPPATLPGFISLTIRKPSERVMRIDDEDFASLFTETNGGRSRRSLADEELASLHAARNWREFFRLAVREKKTIGVCGSVGSGKTTLLKRLLREIPAGQRVVTIEDTAEFGDAGPPNRVNLFYGDGRAGLTAEQVLKASLRMRPDRLVCQEVRGPEAFAFLRGLASGHSGATSWHSEEGHEFDALALMLRQHEAGRAIPDTEMRRHMEQFIDIIAYCTRSENEFSVSRVWLKGASNE